MEQKLPEFNSLQQEAANELTSSDRLTELAKVSIELARLVALNPNTPPELLRELANSSDAITRSHVAANPNTPTEVLLELGGEFPLQLLDNPVFSLLLLENPNLIETIPLTTQRSLLKLEKVPVSFLEWAADKSDQEVQLAVAMNARTPKAALEKLAQSRDSQVIEAARLHVNWASEQTEDWDEAVKKSIELILFSRKDRQYLKELTEKDLIPEFGIERKISGIRYLLAETILEQLARNDFWEIRVAIAENPKTPKSILEQLAWDENAIRNKVARNPNTPEKSLERLAKDNNCGIRREVARNSSTPARVLEQLAKDENVEVRYHLTQNPNLPESILEQLAKDDDFWIREEIVNNLNTVSQVAIAQSLVQNPEGLPDLPVALEYHAKNSTPFFTRLFVLLHPQTPGKALAENSRSLVWLERYAIAQHPNTPLDTLHTLAVDGNRLVRTAARANLQTRHTQP
jgi:hypothetical protein